MALIECSSSSGGGGDYSDLQYENYTAGNIKKDVAVKVKDPGGNVLKTETGTYTVDTFTNLTNANIKSGVTVSVKDTDGTTLKTVTGTYTGAKSWKYSCATITMGATVTLTFNPYFIAIGDWASFGRYFLGCYARNPDTGAVICNTTYAKDSDTEYESSMTVSGKTFKVNSYYSSWNGRSIYYWAIGY